MFRESIEPTTQEAQPIMPCWLSCPAGRFFVPFARISINLFYESPKNTLSCCAGSINGVRFFVEILLILL